MGHLIPRNEYMQVNSGITNQIELPANYPNANLHFSIQSGDVHM